MMMKKKRTPPLCTAGNPQKNLGKFSGKNLIYLKILTSFTSIGLTHVKVYPNS
jgi:hypothetical protein